MNDPVFEIVSERIVKPFTSTPSSLRSYKLSYNDQVSVKAYIMLAFFYQNADLNLQASDSPIISESETSQILEIALSKTLSYYYPFAGRLRDNLYIECNDMGAKFIVARIKCSMNQLQKHPNSGVKDLVFHRDAFLPRENDASLLLVQHSYFDCGGMAVSICMSHKLGDAYTLSGFMRHWSTMVRQPSHIPSPQFVGASIFPPLDDPPLIKEITVSEVPLRKFLFSASKIALLKKMAAKPKWGVQNPTRVEVVSAFLYRCAMVSSMAISDSFRPAKLDLPMNLRPVAVLPKDSVGNLAGGFAITTTKEEEMTFPELVSQLRNAKVKIQNEYREKAKANAFPRQHQVDEDLMNQTTLDNYLCTSWCRFPFYEVDFGGGKPVSLSLPNEAAEWNIFLLMDARDEDSIEATTMLKDAKHMSAFETNGELLAYASLIA